MGSSLWLARYHERVDEENEGRESLGAHENGEVRKGIALGVGKMKLP